MKKRLIGVSGAIVIVLIVVLAVVGAGTAAKTISVAEAAELAQSGTTSEKVQVSGNVVPDSYETTGGSLTFRVYDPEAGEDGPQLSVVYDGAAASTFGNDVTAICTGKIGQDGILKATEMITKCPSKYESASNALEVDRLIGYGDEVVGKMVKVVGIIKAGTLAPAGQGNRFVLTNPSADTEIAVIYEGALSDEVKEGSSVVLLGSLNEEGKFQATEVALEG